MKHLLASVIPLLAFCSALVSAQTSVTADEAATLISRVKQTPASQLDSTLPHMAFEKWVISQVGSDATINWLARTGNNQGSLWVETDVTMQGRPGIVIMTTATPKPKFQSLPLMRAGDFAEWPRLRELRDAVKRAKN